MAMRRFDEMSLRFENALRETAEQLQRQGFYKATDICEKILLSGGYAK